MKQIAFFDFDGTVTHKDTLLEFIKHQKGNLHFYLGFLLNSPFMIAYKTGMISNQWAKERILSYFFGKKSVDQFQQQCNEFAATVIPSLVREKAMKEIKKLQEAGVEVVIVSASAEDWVRPWCEKQQVDCVATRLENKNGFVTGKISGLNCYGEEKVRRVQEKYPLGEYAVIYGYGDTKGDKPLLGLASISFYKPFR